LNPSQTGYLLQPEVGESRTYVVDFLEELSVSDPLVGGELRELPFLSFSLDDLLFFNNAQDGASTSSWAVLASAHSVSWEKEEVV